MSHSFLKGFVAMVGHVHQAPDASLSLCSLCRPPQDVIILGLFVKFGTLDGPSAVVGGAVLGAFGW